MLLSIDIFGTCPNLMVSRTTVALTLKRNTNNVSARTRIAWRKERPCMAYVSLVHSDEAQQTPGMAPQDHGTKSAPNGNVRGHIDQIFQNLNISDFTH